MNSFVLINMPKKPWARWTPHSCGHSFSVPETQFCLLSLVFHLEMFQKGSLWVGILVPGSHSAQSWLTLSRASEAQESAREVPRQVASHRKGQGYLIAWHLAWNSHQALRWVCLWQSLPVSHTLFPSPALPALWEPLCWAWMKVTKTQAPLSEGYRQEKRK